MSFICVSNECPYGLNKENRVCGDENCIYKRFPMTNADRIRAMSDEELEKFLVNYACSNVAPYATARGVMYKGELLAWLKQDAKNIQADKN